MAELELAPMAAHVRSLVADAIAHDDGAAALEAFHAPAGDLADLDGTQLLWLGRAALKQGDVAAAERALGLSAARAVGLEAATAMVLRARLLGERLERRVEAEALMRRVVAEYPATRPADYATRWLGGAR
jgi:hypothetical protein